MEIRRYVVATSILAFCIFYSLNIFAADVPGTLPGQLTITPQGSAHYEIPLTLPPGNTALAPKLTLVYDNQIGNGWLGIGIELRGLSRIERCPASPLLDGAVGDVNYDAGDRFCLDGERLVLASGSNYGAANSEYRSKTETFAKIVANSSQGAGPQSFTVYQPNGQIYYYGTTGDARIEKQGTTQGSGPVRVWALNKIEDLHGNTILFNYTEDTDNGSYYPSTIQYTGNSVAGILPYNTISFSYEARPGAITHYLADAGITTTQRLTALTMQATNLQSQTQTASVYSFNYASVSGAMPFSRLTQMQRCDDGNGTTCFPATQFNWSSAGAYTESMHSGTLPWQNIKSPNVTRLQTADFNGDGLSDWLWWEPNAGQTRWYINQGPATPGGTDVTYAEYVDLIPANSVNAADDAQLQAVDMNSDGLTDVVFYSYQSGENRWYTNNGNLSFSEAVNVIPAGNLNSNVSAKLHFADVNQDGLMDAVWYQRSTGYNTWYLNTGANTFNAIANVISSGEINSNDADILFELMDVDADGRPDIVWRRPGTGDNRWYLHTGLNGSGEPTYAAATINPIPANEINGSGYTFKFTDINGDGLIDVFHHVPSSGENRLYLNRGRDETNVLHFNNALLNAVPANYLNSATPTRFQFADLNGDSANDVQ